MKPDVIRKINGAEYRFRMSLRACIDIETELNFALTSISETPSMNQIATIMRQTIRDADGRKITNEEWESLDDQITFVDATEIITEVMGGSLPAPAAEGVESGKNG
jgi:hypothetical protein